ncbi:hypothetical protein Lal_00015801 [Lupinus albus]|nr:hypothetical protein Lal_00015801 [Lupinus albus]
MANGWQDQRNKQLINFLVYSPKGLSFVRSVDVSDVFVGVTNVVHLITDNVVHLITDNAANYRQMMSFFIELVEFVGVTNVVHLITDNAANYKAAWAMLSEKLPSIFWYPCVAHC